MTKVVLFSTFSFFFCHCSNNSPKLTSVLDGAPSDLPDSVATPPDGNKGQPPELVIRQNKKPASPLGVSVGAFRWDFYYEGGSYPKKVFKGGNWVERLPFFISWDDEGNVIAKGDAQETVDQEILAAANAGLDYWAFEVFTDKDANADYNSVASICEKETSLTCGDVANRSLNLYVKSQYRNLINHALVISPPHIGPKDMWENFIETVMIEHFQMPNYQRVAGDRPLLFFNYLDDNGPKVWGSTDNVKNAIKLITEKTRTVGLADPYLVMLGTKENAKAWGFDAVSGYNTPPNWTRNPVAEADRKTYDFDHCVKLNRLYRYLRQGEVNYLPVLTTGFDQRPLEHGNDPLNIDANGNPIDRSPADICQQPQPEEIADNLRETLSWMSINQEITAKAVVFYAWNEYLEGGWLAPMSIEGSARLDALARVIKNNRCEIYKPNGCPKHPERLDLLASVIFDEGDSAHLNTDRCLKRPREWAEYCGFSDKDIVYAKSFLDNDELGENAIGPLCCVIEKPLGCPTHPEESARIPKIVFDTWMGTDKDKDQCLKRAAEWSSYCGFENQLVSARFFENLKPIETRTNAPNRCEIHKPAGCYRCDIRNPDSCYPKDLDCLNKPDYCVTNNGDEKTTGIHQSSMILDNWENSANNSARCLQRAKEFADYCVLPAEFGKVEAKFYSNDFLTASKQYP